MWQDYVGESQQFYPIFQINVSGPKFRCKLSPPFQAHLGSVGFTLIKRWMQG